MSNSCDTTNTREKEGCGCMDVGTILDNTDNVATFSAVFASEAEAVAKRDALEKKAQETASEPCKIETTLEPCDGGYKLDMTFAFAYQVETVIFQLALR